MKNKLLYHAVLCIILAFFGGGCAVIPTNVLIQEESAQVQIINVPPPGYTYNIIKNLRVEINRLDGSATKQGLMELLRREAHAVRADTVLSPKYDIEFNPFGNIGRATGIAIHLIPKSKTDSTLVNNDTKTGKQLASSLPGRYKLSPQVKDEPITSVKNTRINNNNIRISKNLHHKQNQRVDINSQQIQQKRLALLIGNSRYLHGGALKNPVNDVISIQLALDKLNFTVIKYENANQKVMKKAMDEFGKRLKNYDVGLFFYAGHGIQVSGSNYLIPIDAELDNESDVEYDTVRADRVLAKMEAAGSKTNIVILDACRDNPFERSWRRSSIGAGLAFMNAPSGSIIAYATSPGDTASDGDGQNGLYTSAILEHIQTPGITIEQLFKRVRRTIIDLSNHKQVSWESTSLRGDFYFARE